MLAKNQFEESTIFVKFQQILNEKSASMFWRICKIVICQISKFQLDNVVDLKSAEKRAFSVFPFRPGNLGLSGVLLQLHAPKK